MPRGFSPSRNNWTLHDLDELDEMLHQGKRDTEIARRLGRTVAAIQVIRKRRGLGSVTGATLNARKAGRLLGKDNSVISAWCQRGWLVAHRSVKRGNNWQWCVGEDDLLVFLADSRYWMCWDADAIAEAGLREWAREVRTFAWVPVADVARHFCVCVNTARGWVARGLLPGVHRAGTTWVAGPDVRVFQPPCERSKAGTQHREWTAAEDDRLCRMRAAGWTFSGIGKAMGRSVGSVSNRWYRVVQRVAEVAA